jgi:hypothetical protein
MGHYQWLAGNRLSIADHYRIIAAFEVAYRNGKVGRRLIRIIIDQTREIEDADVVGDRSAGRCPG